MRKTNVLPFIKIPTNSVEIPQQQLLLLINKIPKTTLTTNMWKNIQTHEKLNKLYSKSNGLTGESLYCHLHLTLSVNYSKTVKTKCANKSFNFSSI